VTTTAHQLAFRPRARLVSILGEHLISDQAVALVELVKNSYDADARHVSVELQNARDPATTSVVVTDDGTGMTFEDVSTRWMSPALDDKERAKEAGQRTALGRLPIGEKGVGRFALHQLGRSLQMVTRAAGSPELEVNIDWDDYDRSDAYLADVGVTVLEREREVFRGDATGTRLIITRPRSQWNERLVRKVHRILRRVQSPLREAKQDFRISLVCPDYPELETIESTDILDRAHYEFRVMVGSDGRCDYEYLSRLPGIPGREVSGTENLVSFAADELRAETPQCGPFWFNLHVWDRTRDALQASDVSRAELDALCGVSVYRDGLRVLPYGEPGNDWLFLDQERIQSPADRVGNNQLIGLIEVDQGTNLRLRDKTNREGLIENDAFLDLRALTRAAIRLFTSQWRRDRPPPKAAAVNGEPVESVESARRLARAIQSSASDEVQVQVLSAAEQDATAADSLPGRINGGTNGDTTVSQREAVELLLGELDDVQHGIDVRQERFERLLHLAATGLAAERVVHEFGRQLIAASDALQELRGRRTDAQDEALRTLEMVLTTLQGEFRVLAPYESIRRAPRPRTVGVRELGELALRLNERILDENAVQRSVVGEDFRVRSRGTELLQILDNLVHNAAYWIGTQPTGQDRRMEIVLESGGALLVADTGPGLAEHVRAQAFEPFFSMKNEGSGLGLYISAELAKVAGANLRLLDAGDPHRPSWATGATFVLQLSEQAEVMGA
jgi:signal transduction histidine kinase